VNQSEATLENYGVAWRHGHRAGLHTCSSRDCWHVWSILQYFSKL